MATIWTVEICFNFNSAGQTTYGWKCQINNLFRQPPNLGIKNVLHYENMKSDSFNTISISKGFQINFIGTHFIKGRN